MTPLAQRTTAARDRLLEGRPVRKRCRHLAGVSTAILEAGAGAPIIRLDGPRESTFWWLRVISALAVPRRVVVPDLPYVIDDTGDVPKLERPDAFLEAVSDVLEDPAGRGQPA